MTHLFAATSHDERFARGQAYAAAWLRYRTDIVLAPFDADVSCVGVIADNPDSMFASVQPRADFATTPALFEALVPPGDGCLREAGARIALAQIRRAGDVAGALRFFLHLGFELSYATRATYSGGAWRVLPNTPPGAPSRHLS